MNIMKKFKMTALAIILIIVLLLIISFINHKIRLNKEQTLLTPLGKMVDVNGAQMSVYTEGEGEKTLVFMSGSGTCSPILDFKSLYSQLSGDYKIAVVEKFGYGYSEVVSESRDVDTMLEETREALKQADINGPYILCPHSMSGIEALYWAHKYPDEVSAIIGLDMAVPEDYDKMSINVTLLSLLKFTSDIGITRWIPNAAESDAIKYGTLTDKEKEIYRALFYSKTMSRTMLDEAKYIKKSAELVDKYDTPVIPILMFCSNASGGTGFTMEEWRGIKQRFADKCVNATVINLDCSHYVHDHEYKKIAEEIKKFV